MPSWTRLLLCAAAATASLWPGDLTDRYHLTLDRVLKGGPPVYTEDMVLADAVPTATRRFTEYSGDVSGRYIGALAASGRFEPLQTLLPRLIALQKEPGYFGAGFNESAIGMKEMALLWGNGRLLIGLMEEYQARPRPEILRSAQRIGDFLVRIAPVMNDDALRKRIDSEEFAAGYICWTHNIEGLVALHRATKDPRYLDLARSIAARVARYPGQHSHGFLSSVRGIVDLYKQTGERPYLEKAEREWQGVVDSGNLTVQGAVPEAFAPNNKRTEGCSEADWLRLSLALWQLTGNAKYIDAAERTLFNEFALNEFETGDFGHRPLAPLGVALGAGDDGGGTARAWWCCTLHGLRAFADVFAGVLRGKDGALWLDLPADGAGKTEGFAASVESSLGRDGRVTVAVTQADGAAHSLFVRQPRWAARVSAAVNGTDIAAARREGFVELRRAWKAGDTATVTFAMRTYAIRNEKTGRAALFHGPWLLAADEEKSPYFRDEPHSENVLLVGEPLKLTYSADTGQARFSYPAAHFRVKYLPGGYPMQPAKAELRPVAEQTGTRTLAWDFWFRLGK